MIRYTKDVAKQTPTVIPVWAYLAFAIALASMLGSLYYSEVRDLPPCLLCWYQRICMYPLVVITAVGIWRRDAGMPWYALPLSIAGFGFAVYHYLLQKGIIAEALAPCQAGISCTTKQVEYFGFVTIPFLSGLAFAAIAVCLIVMIRNLRRTK